MPTVPKPWVHQAETTAFFAPRPRGNDFSDPGTGKTRAQIDTYLARKRRGRWLVLCPLTLMESAWLEDCEKFAPGLGVSLATSDQRLRAFEVGTDVVVMNLDGVRWFFDGSIKKPIKERIKLLNGFDHLTMDESTAYKNPQSMRTKMLIRLAQTAKFDNRYAMTGTPNPNSVTELWAPMLVVDGGKRLGDNFYKFRNATQVAHQRGPSAQHLEWRDRDGINLQVDELIADITIRHAFEDVMTHVPANYREEKAFELPKKLKAMYDKLETSTILELQGGIVDAVHAASLRTKLLQMASGAVYASMDDASEYTVLDRSRYSLIADLVEERDHSVTFFNWRHQRDELAAEFTKRRISYALIDGSVSNTARGDIVRRYQNGEYQTVLLHPRTGAHGLTLTRGKTTIFSSPIYEADLVKQAIHRIYRGDQTERTNTIFVRARGTVEDLVYDRVFGKENRMTDLLGLLAQRRAA